MSTRAVHRTFDQVTEAMLLAAEGVPRQRVDEFATRSTLIEPKVPSVGRRWVLTGRVDVADSSSTAPVEILWAMVAELRADGWTEVEDRSAVVRDDVRVAMRRGDVHDRFTLELRARDEPPPPFPGVRVWAPPPPLTRGVEIEVRSPDVNH